MLRASCRVVALPGAMRELHEWVTNGAGESSAAIMTKVSRLFTRLTLGTKGAEICALNALRALSYAHDGPFAPRFS